MCSDAGRVVRQHEQPGSRRMSLDAKKDQQHPAPRRGLLHRQDAQPERLAVLQSGQPAATAAPHGAKVPLPGQWAGDRLHRPLQRSEAVSGQAVGRV